MEPRTGPFLTTVSLSQLSDVGQYDESLSLSALPLAVDDDDSSEKIIYRMSTKVQNPRRKMSRACTMSTCGGFFVNTMKHC